MAGGCILAKAGVGLAQFEEGIPVARIQLNQFDIDIARAFKAV